MFRSLQSITKMITAGLPVFSCLFVLVMAFTEGPSTGITIKAVILDEKASPVTFATIMVKGHKTAIQSDSKGAFTIRVPSLPVTLVCSAAGFETTEFTVNSHLLREAAANIVITMKAASTSLDEVVVVGYSKSRRMDYTGSASTVAAPVPEGKISGISHAPGVSRSVAVRGTSSPSPEKLMVATKMAPMPLEEHPDPTFGYKRSKLLTAGEVNDFKKWKMWEDYNEGDFKTHSDKWELYATRRYSVLLQNNDHKGLVGQKVHLLSSSGDTLWTAVSDNTGKAELWKGFSAKYDGNDVRISVESNIFPAIPFAQGINRITLGRACTVSNKIEIAFVVDATGSMQDEIEYLKEELGDILTKVAAKDPSLNFQTGSVFYRDKGDAYVTSLQPMTAGIENTLAFIKRQYADGGGDYPEALKEALADATHKLVWTKEARARIIFLLMDAPPHDHTKTEMAKLIKEAAAKGIRVVPVACSGTDKATEFIMRSIALATNGTYLFLTDHSGIGNPHIKPTTDEFKVELLNDLLQRTIEQMCYSSDCSGQTKTIEPLSLYTNIEKIRIFPNPSTGPATLETNRVLKELYIADFTGKILFRKAVNNKMGRIRLDLSGLPSATYFVRYVTADNKTGAEKLVIAR